jgi:glycosyltransferase involved in cell wall biosynthesis
MSLVSICIPTYNHGRFIADALRSAMAQSHTDLDIVVLDNASEDDTAATVARVASGDPRVRYLRHPRNLGMMGNLNACIEHARGEYLKLLMADDLLEPDCVLAMARILDEDPSIALVGCARTLTDEGLVPQRVARSCDETRRVTGERMISRCFFLGNQIGEPTAVMFRRASAVRGFNADYNQLVDLEMWFYLLCRGDFVALATPLCRIRLHPGQTSRANEQSGRALADRRRLFNEFAQSAARFSGVWLKLLWDFRMAYSVARIAPVPRNVLLTTRNDTFFPQLYAWLTYPLTRLLTVLGLGLIWKAA